MAWVAVNKDGTELIGEDEYWFKRVDRRGRWFPSDDFATPIFELPRGSIEKLIGRKLTWNDEPIELKDEK